MADDFEVIEHGESANIGSEKQCNRCQLPFTLFRRRHHCRTCQLAFCDEDCHKHPEENISQRICHSCLDNYLKTKTEAQQVEIRARAQTIQREERERKLSILLQDCQQGEASSRTDIVTQEATEFAPFSKSERRDRKLASESTKQREADEAEKAKSLIRNATLDKWAAQKGARCGAVTLTVVRAANVRPASLTLHCSPFVVVKYGSNELRSGAFYHDPNPEFDFIAYFLVDNDQDPIVITLMDDNLVTPAFLGNLTVNLRRSIPNLVKEVSDSGVLIEKASVLQAVYDEKGLKVPDTQVFIKWSFEVRETNTHVFCPTCGRVDSRCTCSDQQREERFAARESERLEREREIIRETTRRLETEAQQKKEREEQDARRKEREERERVEAQRRAEENQRRREQELARRNGKTDANAVSVEPDPSMANPQAIEPAQAEQAEETSKPQADGPVFVDQGPPPKQENKGCCVIQ